LPRELSTAAAAMRPAPDKFARPWRGEQARRRDPVRGLSGALQRGYGLPFRGAVAYRRTVRVGP